MKTNKTFVLIGFDHFENNNRDQYPLFRVMQERGFNIVRHNSESDGRNIRFLTYQNNRPTVVIGVMSDKDREIYFDIPAIHFDDVATVRRGDHDLTDGYTLADLDEIIYGTDDEDEEEKKPAFDYNDDGEDDEDDDYYPVGGFSGNGYGYHSYNEAFEML
ncbi:hypothetical protein A4M37_19365 [Salmonella enterica subsp. enterica serovar Typhimurium]|nr:hypothetical protein [Salmonella enterica subsp. enterica serovar Typhimurium]EHH7668521.1 hypothetical protein [Salmonella enterica]